MNARLTRTLLAVAALVAVAAIAFTAYQVGLHHAHGVVAGRPRYARYRDDGLGLFLLFRALFNIGLIVVIVVALAAVFPRFGRPPRWPSARERLEQWHSEEHAETTPSVPTSELPAPPPDRRAG